MKCPKCDSVDVASGWHTYTLLGWFPRKGEKEPHPDDDPNHHTMECACRSCGLAFQKHWRPRNKSEWYTDGETLLAGTPGCCERRWVPVECSGCGQTKICPGWRWSTETGAQQFCRECR